MCDGYISQDVVFTDSEPNEARGIQLEQSYGTHKKKHRRQNRAQTCSVQCRNVGRRWVPNGWMTVCARFGWAASVLRPIADSWQESIVDDTRIKENRTRTHTHPSKRIQQLAPIRWNCFKIPVMMRFDASYGFRVRSQLDFCFEAVALVQINKKHFYCTIIRENNRNLDRVVCIQFEITCAQSFFGALVSVYIVRQTFDK